MDFSSFYSDTLATIVGGIILAILFFIFKERVFPLPDLSGRWYLQQYTSTTSYQPYSGMILRYIVMLHVSGTKIEGTAEKYYEETHEKIIEYDGKDRIRAVISGYIEKRYLGYDRIYLHSIESGQLRESTNFYILRKNNKQRYIGTFTSMIANQDGYVTCQRKKY